MLKFTVKSEKERRLNSVTLCKGLMAQKIHVQAAISRQNRLKIQKEFRNMQGCLGIVSENYMKQPLKKKQWIYIYTYIYTYIHIYIYTYIHIYIYTYIHASLLF
jgi:hypothetical protein